MKKQKILFFTVFFFLLIISFAIAAETDSNFVISSEGKRAEKLIASMELEIEKMTFNGINTQRVTDLILLAKEMFKIQKENEQSKEKTDYSMTISKVQEAQKIEGIAFNTKNELKLLDDRIEQTLKQNPDLDMNEISDIIKKAKSEFRNERFELSIKLIDDAHKKITEKNTLSARSAAFYNETKKTVSAMVEKYGQTVGIIIAVIAILYLLFKKKIKEHSLKGKIILGEKEHSMLLEVIKQAQKEYFEDGILSESVYNTRMKMYTDKARDNDRELALLKEELEFLWTEKKIKSRTGIS